MTTPTAIPEPTAPDDDGPGATGDRGWRAALKRWWWAIAAVLVLVIGAISVLAVNRAGDQDTAPTTAAPTTGSTVATQTTAAPTTDPTTSSPTTATTVTPTTAAPDLSTALWPGAGADRRFTDPVDAARRFATEYLGFVDPVVGPFRQGDSRSGEVDVRPRPEGPVTIVLVRQLDAAGHWYVLGADTDTIEVTTPTGNATVGTPIALAGRAHAFEGVVNVEVRRDGQTRPVGTGIVMGGGTEMLPFTGEVVYTATSGPGALVFFELSAQDGTITKATVIRVQLRGDG